MRLSCELIRGFLGGAESIGVAQHGALVLIINLTRRGLKTKLKHELLAQSVMSADQIDQLEAKINRLIEQHERVKKEKASVEKKLQQKESEWHHLRGQLRQYERERLEIRDKLDKIIGQFANLELPE